MGIPLQAPALAPAQQDLEVQVIVVVQRRDGAVPRGKDLNGNILWLDAKFARNRVKQSSHCWEYALDVGQIERIATSVEVHRRRAGHARAKSIWAEERDLVEAAHETAQIVELIN